MHLRRIHFLYALAIASGILYASWPFGFWLNRPVAIHSLASGLQAVGQPFSWLFVATDIASSVLVILLVFLLWRKYKDGGFSSPARWSLLCFGLFAVGTIADALIPERCVPGLMACASFTQDHILLVHGLLSILASIFLFLGLLILWIYMRSNFILDALIAGYVFFGLISLVQALTPGKDGNWSQDYYITLCSVCLAFVPYLVGLLVSERGARQKNPANQP